MVEWLSLDHTTMLPGTTGPRLEYASLGVVGVVQAWALPYVPVPTEGDVMSSSDIEPAPVFVTTIGVVPAPSISSSADLIAFLQTASSNACTMAWISNAGICNSLTQKLAAASASLARGDTTTAKHQLGAFENELDAQRGKRVSENAYWLLMTNTTYVLGHL